MNELADKSLAIWENTNQELYEKAYDLDFMSDFRRSKEAKRDIWNILSSSLNMDDSGVVHFYDDNVSIAYSLLEDLIKVTADEQTKKRLRFIADYFYFDTINCGRASKNEYERKEGYKKHKFGKEWPFPKSKEVSLCKLISALYDEKFSQVFSKIYSSKKQKFYISVRPSDFLMISDSEHFSSCHSTTDEGSYKEGNISYLRDPVTFVVYAGEPEGKKWTHKQRVYNYAEQEYEDKETEMFTPNMKSRILCFYDSGRVFVGKPYGYGVDRIALLKRLGEVFNIENGVIQECETDEDYEADDKGNNYCTDNVEYNGYGYNDGWYTAYGKPFNDGDIVLSIG